MLPGSFGFGVDGVLRSAWLATSRTNFSISVCVNALAEAGATAGAGAAPAVTIVLVTAAERNATVAE